MKKRAFPEVGELVIATVDSVKDYGAFVKLDEYPNKIGFVHITEISSGWVKYIRDYVREGQKIVCQVMNVTPSKGHVDLSLKRVNDHQKRTKVQEYKNEQKAEKLVEIVAERLNMSKDEFLETYEEELSKKYGSLYDAFEEASVNENALAEDGFSGDWVSEFVKVARENITPTFIKIIAYLNITVKAKDGIDLIKKALALLNNPDEGITVQYVGAPKYRINVKADNFKIGEEILRKYANETIKYIKDNGGTAELIRKVD
ncbi:MAG: translation initiation factor IF-2 subunit alpha [Thermoplasmata archaeon]